MRRDAARSDTRTYSPASQARLGQLFCNVLMDLRYAHQGIEAGEASRATPAQTS